MIISRKQPRALLLTMMVTVHNDKLNVHLYTISIFVSLLTHRKTWNPSHVKKELVVDKHDDETLDIKLRLSVVFSYYIKEDTINLTKKRISLQFRKGISQEL